MRFPGLVSRVALLLAVGCTEHADSPSATPKSGAAVESDASARDGSASPRSDATQADATQADATQVDATQVDATKPDPAPPWTEPPRTHLLLQRHAPTDPTADLLPIDLTAEGGPTPLPSVGQPAIANPRWPGHHVALAAHGGRARFVTVGGSATPWSLTEHEAGTTAPGRTTELPGELPAAMHLVHEQLLLGQANEVALVDLGAAEPARTVLHTQPDMMFKAYDLFVRHRDWVIAIDDEVTPVYADGFQLRTGRSPVHEVGWELPGAINGHYYAGTLVPEPGAGPRDATLYTLLGYGILDGHGQDLAALPLVANALEVPEGELVNQTSTKLRVLEEHVDRGTGRPTSLAAGTEYSRWSAIGHHTDDTGARLLLCAGPRDLLVLPLDFDARTKAETIELSGDCLDLLVEGSQIWVLIDPDRPSTPAAGEWKAPAASRLLALALTTGKAPSVRERYAIDLPGHHRFVR